MKKRLVFVLSALMLAFCAGAAAAETYTGSASGM